MQNFHNFPGTMLQKGAKKTQHRVFSAPFISTEMVHPPKSCDLLSQQQHQNRA